MDELANTPLYRLMLRVNAKRSGSVDEWTLNCPFCEERDESPDTRWRLGINSRKGTAHCFNCNYHKTTQRGVCADICRVYGLGDVFISTRSVSSAIAPMQMKLQAIGLPDGYESFSGNGDYVERKALKYLTKRGITQEQIKQHQIGFAATGYYAYRIIFPVFGLNSKIYGVVARAFAGQEPRYLNSKGMRLLWGANQKADIAIATEGIFDALKVASVLTDTEKQYTVVARLGTTVTPQQCRQLKRYKETWVFPDPNEPGIKGAITFAKQADEGGVQNIQICLPEKLDGVDPADMNSGAIWRMIGNRYPAGKSTEFRLRKLLRT